MGKRNFPVWAVICSAFQVAMSDRKTFFYATAGAALLTAAGLEAVQWTASAQTHTVISCCLGYLLLIALFISGAGFDLNARNRFRFHVLLPLKPHHLTLLFSLLALSAWPLRLGIATLIVFSLNEVLRPHLPLIAFVLLVGHLLFLVSLIVSNVLNIRNSFDQYKFGVWGLLVGFVLIFYFTRNVAWAPDFLFPEPERSTWFVVLACAAMGWCFATVTMKPGAPAEMPSSPSPKRMSDSGPLLQKADLSVVRRSGHTSISVARPVYPFLGLGVGLALFTLATLISGDGGFLGSPLYSGESGGGYVGVWLALCFVAYPRLSAIVVFWQMIPLHPAPVRNVLIAVVATFFWLLAAPQVPGKPWGLTLNFLIITFGFALPACAGVVATCSPAGRTSENGDGGGTGMGGPEKEMFIIGFVFHGILFMAGVVLWNFAEMNFLWLSLLAYPFNLWLIDWMYRRY